MCTPPRSDRPRAGYNGGVRQERNNGRSGRTRQRVEREGKTGVSADPPGPGDGGIPTPSGMHTGLTKCAPLRGSCRGGIKELKDMRVMRDIREAAGGIWAWRVCYATAMR